MNQTPEELEGLGESSVEEGIASEAARSFNLAGVPIPSRFEVNYTDEELVIFHKWWSFKYIGLALFCVAWFAFLGYVFTINKSAILFVFAALQAAIGVFLAYYTAAGFVNSTIITVTLQELTISHGPMWWPGGQTLQTETIEQLYCKEVERRNTKTDSEGNRTESIHYSYELYSLNTNNRSVKLISGLDEPEEALFMERVIEDFLGIEEAPVLGEMSR